MDAQEVVKIEDVWVHYDGVPILEDINLAIERDDFLGIIGPNGGGKTTLLKVILGLVRPSRGRAVVFGASPQQNRHFIGYVPQHPQFDPQFPISAWEVVMTGRWGQTGLFRRYRQEDQGVARNALEMVDMYQLRHRAMGQLSGGERQRVFLARALAMEPKLLLLDEPTASVDPGIQTGVYELLQRLNQEIPIVVVTHDIGVISSYVKQIACLNRQLFYHRSKEITAEMLAAVYHCPVDMIAHGLPHRVLGEHDGDQDGASS